MNLTRLPVQTEDARSVTFSAASSTATSLFPVSIVMAGKIALGWELVNQFYLSLDRESDGSYLVSDDIFNIYGEGATPGDAVLDHLKSLIEYYEIVSAQDDAPSRALLAELQRHVRRVRG